MVDIDLEICLHRLKLLIWALKYFTANLNPILLMEGTWMI